MNNQIKCLALNVLIAFVALLRADLPVHAAQTDGKLVAFTRLPGGGIQPQAITDRDGVTHLIYFSGEPMHGDVFYVRSADGGASFSKPIRVNSQVGSVIAIGTVRGAHLAVGRNGRVHVAWMGSGKAEPKAAGKSSPMLYTRLNDAGDAFEPQRNVIRRRPGLDGGGSIAADAEGNVYVAWHSPKDSEDEANRYVWVARSSDDGRAFAEEISANPKPTGACGCCGMRIFADGDGVYVLYRAATEMVNRGMHLLVSRDNAATFEDVKAHPWKIGKCVMSTAAFAGGTGGVVAAWETREQIYFSKLSEHTSTAPTASPAPGEGQNRKHPALALGRNGRFVLAWTEGTGWNKGGVVRWQAFEKDGTPIPRQSGQIDGLPAWSVPAVVAVADGSFRVVF